jgi:hypothetical protein
VTSRDLCARVTTIALLLLTLAAGCNRAVEVNGVALSAAELRDLEARYTVRVRPGAYWYDRASGLWGVRGRGTSGLVLAGLTLGGGALARDASSGTTGVFVNGRELPGDDLAALEALVGAVPPGRYFLDGDGNAGPEGGAPVVNLWSLAAASGSPFTRRTVAGGIGGDGQGCFYFIDADTSYTSGGC